MLNFVEEAEMKKTNSLFNAMKLLEEDQKT